MDHDRRTFLKTTSLAGVAAMAAAASVPAATDAHRAGRYRAQANRASLRRAWSSPRCGGRTGLRARAAHRPRRARRGRRRAGFPRGRTHHDRRGVQGPGRHRRPPAPRRQGARQRRLPTATSWRRTRPTFGPCVTNPEKIICIGLNYRKHIAEMNAQVPTMPVLFSKFNTALNHQGGTIERRRGRTPSSSTTRPSW